MFAFTAEIRKLLYTTVAIENSDRSLRKVLATRGHFPGERRARRQLRVAIRNIRRLEGPRPGPAGDAKPEGHPLGRPPEKCAMNHFTAAS